MENSTIGWRAHYAGIADGKKVIRAKKFLTGGGPFVMFTLPPQQSMMSMMLFLQKRD